ncbi:MAG: NADP oxidoreductase [Rhodococcus sp. (in: high G+C Gram-positive bacteria)]|jgi:predicted dinucleotide-binding enzyme|nr:MAG: NADP oxidoreductase [Rhodococcus sp. (in: high G+C Gram-positive bacteria)]
MKIGILGAGYIGATLARKLSSAGHEVKVANSRGPDTIDADVLATGASAVDAADIAADVDVVVLSIPLHRIPGIAPLVSTAPADTVVIDTSNYYPARDTRIEAVESGQAESLWVQEQLDRPIVKAWNAIGSDSFATRGAPAASPGRIAVPVAADDPRHRRVGIALVDDTGFDGYDAGTLAQSWRQQPGTPSYCTDLTRDEMAAALAAADAERSPKRRDIAAAAFAERYDSPTLNPTADHAVRLNRALFM